MDHEAYEKEMIDQVNRNAEDKDLLSTHESAVTDKKVFTKADSAALIIGLKRTLLALFTTFTFALSVFAFIIVAMSTGYWAVVSFFGAILLLVLAFVLLYAQGIPAERPGDEND